MKHDTILARMDKGSEQSSKFYENGGKMSGGVYINDKAHWDMVSDAMRSQITSNPLHMMEFSFVGQLEAEIIRMTLDLFNADKKACGITTSGGTESIILAVLAYREQAKLLKGITKPNLVISSTAHAAFDKACFYLKIEIRKARITKDLKYDIEAAKELIDSNTICIVGSAPEYGFGNYDPIPELSELALERGIGLHVDACLGSYVNCFAE
jgi:sphinganine-1-phosphate aldolase